MTYEEARFWGSHYPEDEGEDDSWDAPETEYTTRKEMEAEE